MKQSTAAVFQIIIRLIGILLLFFWSTLLGAIAAGVYISSLIGKARAHRNSNSHSRPEGKQIFLLILALGQLISTITAIAGFWFFPHLPWCIPQIFAVCVVFFFVYCVWRYSPRRQVKKIDLSDW